MDKKLDFAPVCPFIDCGFYSKGKLKRTTSFFFIEAENELYLLGLFPLEAVEKQPLMEEVIFTFFFSLLGKMPLFLSNSAISHVFTCLLFCLPLAVVYVVQETQVCEENSLTHEATLFLFVSPDLFTLERNFKA